MHWTAARFSYAAQRSEPGGLRENVPALWENSETRSYDNGLRVFRSGLLGTRRLPIRCLGAWRPPADRERDFARGNHHLAPDFGHAAQGDPHRRARNRHRGDRPAMLVVDHAGDATQAGCVLLVID